MIHSSNPWVAPEAMAPELGLPLKWEVRWPRLFRKYSKREQCDPIVVRYLVDFYPICTLAGPGAHIGSGKHNDPPDDLIKFLIWRRRQRKLEYALMTQQMTSTGLTAQWLTDNWHAVRVFNLQNDVWIGLRKLLVDDFRNWLKRSWESAKN